MSFIKFPTQIPPARVTVQLQRTDEIFVSPITNIQQVVSRGNPVWKWTYEYTDLSEDEREVVEAFLMNCRGTLNTFKVSDPAEYSIRGSLSDWIDIFSGYGSFNVTAGAAADKVNSWFVKDDGWDTHITDEQTALFETRHSTSVQNLRWFGHGSTAKVNSLQKCANYLQRIKFFNRTESSFIFAVTGDATNPDILANGPASSVYSSSIISMPFVVYSSTQYAGIYTDATQSRLTEQFEFADYSFQRCALVVKSENLLTYSNSFGASDWSKNAISFLNNASDDPRGGNATWFALVNSDQSATSHYFSQANLTKPNTEDIYTAAIYAKKGNFLEGLRVRLDDNTSLAYADFDLVLGVTFFTGHTGAYKLSTGKIWDVGSGWYRCQLTCQVSSHSQLTLRIYAINSQGGSQNFTTTDTSWIYVNGASVVKFPLMKPYYETGASEIVGTGSLVGSQVYMDGFDAEDKIKAGTRIEIINRYHDEANDYYERSEFKRITNEVRASREGHALVSFDPPIRNEPIAQMVRPGGEVDQTMHNAVVFHKPEMKARLLAGTVQFIEKPLRLTDIVFETIEDLTE